MKSVRMLNGYRVIYSPEHTKAMKTENWLGYVYEHIIEAERELGRPLRKGEVVHHLNGKRDDNRTSNLIVLENAQHLKLHRWLHYGAPYEGPVKGYTNKPRETVRYCAVCKEIIQCSANNTHCSNKCRAISQRRVERPTSEMLALEIATSTWVALGRKYGVSDNAIKKWARSYGLIK